ncbi:MAG: hypothetical protein RMY29_030530 [Nostoc sp. CreGUA01]|nr:hypothetical protein [Nostoc sp. CreGUA01]
MRGNNYPLPTPHTPHTPHTPSSPPTPSSPSSPYSAGVFKFSAPWVTLAESMRSPC